MNGDINLTDINWKHLSIKELSKLSDKLNKKRNKNVSPKIENELFIITINGYSFEVKEQDYLRYKTIKTVKNRQKFFEYLKKSYQIIEEL